MSFFETLDRVRSKPEAQRKRLALFFSIAITFIVVLFWFATFSLPLFRGKEATGVKKDSRLGSTLSEFFLEVKKGVGIVEDEVGKLKSIGTIEIQNEK